MTVINSDTIAPFQGRPTRIDPNTTLPAAPMVGTGAPGAPIPASVQEPNPQPLDLGPRRNLWDPA